MALAFLIFSEGFEKTHEKFRGLHTVTTVCPAFLIDVRFLSELRGSLFYFLFRFFEPELTVVLPAFLLFAACTSVATCMFFNFMTRTTFIAKKRRKKSSINQFYIIRYVHRCAFVQEPLEVQKHVIVFS